MSQNPNPFLRGYWNLKIVRTLSISYEDGSPHVWRNIHASQQHLSDEELRERAEPLVKSGYGRYLLDVLDRETTPGGSR